MSDIKQFLTTDELEEGGFLKIDGNQVIYRASKIKRKITDPEERVRAEYYLELIKKYKYSDKVVHKRSTSGKICQFGCIDEPFRI